jgi:hypothetical protein
LSCSHHCFDRWQHSVIFAAEAAARCLHPEIAAAALSAASYDPIGLAVALSEKGHRLKDIGS